MIEWFVLLMYWTVDGRFHHEVSPPQPGEVVCNRSGAEVVKTVGGQGAIKPHFRCISADERPEGLPEFIQQPKPGPAA
jgi:hypothetical protein